MSARDRPSLCVGLATYDDYDGAWFTIQAICLYQREVLRDVSFVVVDNHPEGPAADALRSLGDFVPGYRYVPFDGFAGTSVRDLVFREARSEIVCCVDSHVLLFPGALAALQEWFAQRPDSRDLLQGPIAWDDLCHGTSHMEPVWRAGMFGVWAADGMPGVSTEPFEIPLQGLGLFACRRAAWPGINPRFRGFGGEEGYLHEKVRRGGGRVLCHPALRWLHRFGRPAGPRYANVWEDRIRNYILGWSEIGWDLAPVRTHFEALLGPHADAAWTRARTEAEHALNRFDGVFCVADDGQPCAAHGHPQSIDWRVEPVPGWRSALGEASRRGYQSLLIVDGRTRAIDPTPAEELARSGRGWDICRLGGAVAIHARAFERVGNDLEHGRIPSEWLEQPVAGGKLADGGRDRLAVCEGVNALERDDGVTVRHVASPRAYDLNRTASLVLDLCDGTRTVADVAHELAVKFRLASAPVADVRACVEQLRDAGILSSTQIAR